MNKSIITYFFMILFGALIFAPAIIMAIDDSADLSCFYSISEEEEENKGNEKNKVLDLIISMSLLDAIIFSKLKACNTCFYEFKNYCKPQLNHISPPPEFS